MEQIAAIIGNTYIYWSNMIRVLAVGAAVCCFWALYLFKSGKLLTASIYVPLAVAASVMFSRIVHWYFRPDLYESLSAALDLQQGSGFALLGAFAGCILAAVAVRLLCLTKNLPELLDCICIAGCLGIGVGRLASWFNASDRGMVVNTAQWFPWVSSITNAVSGAQEFRLSVFLLQAVVCGVLFLVLLLWYVTGWKHHRDGDAALLFCLCYGASQVLLDSMRYDPLRFPGNGFISGVQVAGAVGILLAVLIFGAALVGTTGWKQRYWILFGLQAGCFAAAGYMEYYVQRHGDRALLAYGMMTGALTGLVGLTMVIRCLSEGRKEGNEHGTASEKTDQIPE